jgi:hypothetical protein
MEFVVLLEFWLDRPNGPSSLGFLYQLVGV